MILAIVALPGNKKWSWCQKPFGPVLAVPVPLPHLQSHQATPVSSASSTPIQNHCPPLQPVAPINSKSPESTTVGSLPGFKTEPLEPDER